MKGATQKRRPSSTSLNGRASRTIIGEDRLRFSFKEQKGNVSEMQCVSVIVCFIWLYLAKMARRAAQCQLQNVLSRLRTESNFFDDERLAQTLFVVPCRTPLDKKEPKASTHPQCAMVIPQNDKAKLGARLWQTTPAKGKNNPNAHSVLSRDGSRRLS